MDIKTKKACIQDIGFEKQWRSMARKKPQSLPRHAISVPRTIQRARAKRVSLYRLRALLSGRDDKIVELTATNVFHRGYISCA
ncbi:hypothetical protein [Dyella sp. RRB7]|uniref:hypothetical protein n=1 Tax=Dyella sp. RRB7 TaxID=2919502 RepID=UPI001FA96F26|nr:hypothetical protein [Dyella sp. RRB7]